MEDSQNINELIHIRRQIYSAIWNFTSYNTQVGVPISEDEVNRLSNLLSYLNGRLIRAIYILNSNNKLNS